MKAMKKVMATAVTAALVAANCMPVMAAEWVEGDGTINKEPKDVISVVVPTSAAFDFDIDGGKLLSAKDSETYKNSTLLFKNTAEASIDKTDGYTNTSDMVKIVNMSSCAVDITITGTVSGITDDQIAVATDSSAITGTEEKPTIYLALAAVTNGEVSTDQTALTTAGADFTNTLVSDADEYEKFPGTTTDDGINQWSQALKSDADGSDPLYFVLTGNASANGDTVTWDNVTAAPKVTMTYTIKVGDNDVTAENVTDVAPSVATAATLDGSGNAVVTYSLGAGKLAATGITSIVWQNLDLTSSFTNDGAGTLTVTAATLSGWNKGEQTFTVTFNDSEATTGTFTINIK